MNALDALDLDRLAMTVDQVARLTQRQREARNADLCAEGHAILSAAIHDQVTAPGKELAAVTLMWTGGNDSTTMAHLFRDQATSAGLANTGEGVGLDETRQFVRDTAKAWRLPLLERQAPRPEDSYRAHVMTHGFPGAGKHELIFQRLKERAFRVIRNDLLHDAGHTSRTGRVVFIAGRRRTESLRRGTVPAVERVGSIVWASPMVNWTKLDLNTYRLLAAERENPVPVNMVAQNIHMSGECLCGCYAKEGERAMIEHFYPLAFTFIQELEDAIRDREDIPEPARTWGWSWDQVANDRLRVKSRPGFMCGTC